MRFLEELPHQHSRPIVRQTTRHFVREKHSYAHTEEGHEHTIHAQKIQFANCNVPHVGDASRVTKPKLNH